MSKKIKALITGATGFVGSNLAQYLSMKENFEVGLLQRQGSKFQFAEAVLKNVKIFSLQPKSANIEEILSSFKPDVVIHLATFFLSSHRKDQIDDLIESNVTFPTKLVEAMAACGVSNFINTGTYAEHYNCNPQYDPVTLYAATKKGFEDILRYYVNAKKMNHIKIKLYDTYGPHDPRRKILGIIAAGIREGKPMNMTPGLQEMDLVYIDDIVRAYELAAQYIVSHKNVDEEVEVASGQKHTLREIVSVIEKTIGKKIEINWGAMPYRDRDNMVVNPNLSSAKELLGWQPKVMIEEGFKHVFKGDKT